MRCMVEVLSVAKYARMMEFINKYCELIADKRYDKGNFAKILTCPTTEEEMEELEEWVYWYNDVRESLNRLEMYYNRCKFTARNGKAIRRVGYNNPFFIHIF